MRPPIHVELVHGNIRPGVKDALDIPAVRARALAAVLRSRQVTPFPECDRHTDTPKAIMIDVSEITGLTDIRVNCILYTDCLRIMPYCDISALLCPDLHRRGTIKRHVMSVCLSVCRVPRPN